MTWSLLGEAKFDGTPASRFSLCTTFLDTWLNSLPEWSVTAHPSGQTYRRMVTRTYNNVVNSDMTTTDFRYNVNLSTEAMQSYHGINFYVDHTYTTTPGDLGTSTNSGTGAWAFTYATTGDKMKFWVSSEDANCWLLTMGGKYVLSWSYTGAFTQMGIKAELDAWNAGSMPAGPYPGTVPQLDLVNVDRTWFSGYNGGTNTSTRAYLQYAIGGGSATNSSYLASDPTAWMGAGTQMYRGGTDPHTTLPMFSNTCKDFGVLMPIPGNGTNVVRLEVDTNIPGTTYLLNGTDHYVTFSSSTGPYFAAWDFGTNEPVLN